MFSDIIEIEDKYEWTFEDYLKNNPNKEKIILKIFNGQIKSTKENSKSENYEIENLESENSDIENSETENCESENSDIENSDMENSESENSDMENSDIENCEFSDILTIKGDYHFLITENYNKMKFFYEKSIKYNNAFAMENLAFYYEEHGDYEKMKKYYLMAIEQNNFNAMNNLALYYEEIGDFENMEKYYKMAIDQNYSDAMNNLADYYKKIEDYKNMEKYYLMAIEQNDTYAMYEFALYYEKIGDYENMEKYYKMAINQNHSDSMNNLGFYYEEQKNYEEMKKYYLMAIDQKNCVSMNNLAIYYGKIADYDNLKKYFLMAIELKDSNAMHNLGNFYEKNIEKNYTVIINDIKIYENNYELISDEQENYEKMEMYYKMAIEIGNAQSLINLLTFYKNKNLEIPALNTSNIKFPIKIDEDLINYIKKFINNKQNNKLILKLYENIINNENLMVNTDFKINVINKYELKVYNVHLFILDSVYFEYLLKFNVIKEITINVENFKSFDIIIKYLYTGILDFDSINEDIYEEIVFLADQYVFINLINSCKILRYII